MFKKILAFGLITCLLFGLTACNSQIVKDENDDKNDKQEVEVNEVDYDNVFEENEEKLLTNDILKKIDKKIFFTEEMKESYSITDGGVYSLSGTYNGSIKINTEDEVTLILDNLVINSVDASIIVSNALRCNIYVKEDTINTLTNSTRETADTEEDFNAVIYSKSDLYISGKGSLIIKSNYEDGIVSKDNLVLGNTKIDIVALDDGIVGKDSLSIYDTDISLTSENNGLKTDNTDLGKGFIYIKSGTFNIETTGDAISADNDLIIDDGNFNIKTGKGADAAPVEDSSNNMMETFKPTMPEETENPDMEISENSEDENFFDRLEDFPEDMFNRIEMPQRPEGDIPTDEGMQKPSDFNSNNENMNIPIIPNLDDLEEESNEDEISDEEISCKGLKAGNSIIINNGDFVFDTYSDSIHSDGNISIKDGKFEIKSGDDAIHSEKEIVIDDGNINILYACEGIEGEDIVINNGNITIETYDDGINASNTITINDGEIFINVSINDAIDANGSSKGSITINGGEVIAIGGNTPEGAFDNDNNTIVINGGYVFGFGGVASVLDNSNQQFISLNGEVSNTIQVQTNDKVLYVFDIEESLGNGEFFISIPELIEEDSYSIYINDVLFKEDLSVSENTSNIGGFMPNKENNKNNKGFWNNDDFKDKIENNQDNVEDNTEDELIGDFILNENLA